MKAAHLEAAFPERYQILGLTLKPFCIGHFLILENCGSPFVTPIDRPVTENDLILAVAVCSRSYEEAREITSPQLAFKILKPWMRTIYPRLFFFRKKINWFFRFRLFDEYISAAIQSPLFWTEEGSDRESLGAHFTEHLLVSLMGLGFTYSEAMNLPLKQARRLFLTKCEIDLRRKVLKNQDDDDAKKKADQLFEKLNRLNGCQKLM
jgi:hypothetical protein